MGVKFVGVQKDWRGNITRVRTNDGRLLSIHDARVLALSGEVDCLTGIHADGTWEVEVTEAAGSSEHHAGTSLDELPEFR